MTSDVVPPISTAALKTRNRVGKSASRKQQQDTSSTADDRGQKIDRPGFDLGGSTGDTHAGTGLGLGEDAFDTPGERRLPGRRLDGKVTIPRWSGPEPRDAPSIDKKTEGARTSPTAPTKADR